MSACNRTRTAIVLADLFDTCRIEECRPDLVTEVPELHDPSAYDGLRKLIHAIRSERTADKVGAALVACAASPKSVLEFARGVANENRIFNVALDVAVKLCDLNQFLVALKSVSKELPPMYAAEKLVAAALSDGISMDGPNRGLMDGVYSRSMLDLIHTPSMDLRRDRLRLPYRKIGDRVTFVLNDHSRDPVQQLLRLVPSVDAMLKSVQVDNARLVIAGGAPLGAVTGILERVSDLDIFVVSELQDVEAATKLVIDSIRYLLHDNQKCSVHLTPTVVTVQIPENSLAVQFVLRLYTSAPQLLMSFDMAPSRFLMEANGEMSCTRSAAWAVANKLTLPDPLMTTYSARSFKYSKKGLPFAIPRMDWLIPAAGNVMYMDDQKLKETMRQTSITGILAFAQLMLIKRCKVCLDAEMYGESESKSAKISGRLVKAWFMPYDIAWTDELRALMVMQWCVTDPCIRMAVSSGSSYLM